MKNVASLGKCGFCKKLFSRSSITKHLDSCEKRRGTQSVGGRVFELMVEGRESPWYWLVLEVPEEASLRALDRVLRLEWLECCGHLSAFKIKQKTYSSDEESELEFGDEGMDLAAGKVLSPGLKFYHEYDFGSTTELALKVVSQRLGGSAKNKRIIVLARNEPPNIPCKSCGKNAVLVCAYCLHEGKGWLCKECSKKHKCGEEARLPVVNSPRVGECGYRGRPY